MGSFFGFPWPSLTELTATKSSAAAQHKGRFLSMGTPQHKESRIKPPSGLSSPAAVRGSRCDRESSAHSLPVPRHFDDGSVGSHPPLVWDGSTGCISRRPSHWGWAWTCSGAGDPAGGVRGLAASENGRNAFFAGGAAGIDALCS
jgi:hypothetical protein